MNWARSMGDWVGLGIIAVVLLGAFFGLARLGAPPEELTGEEFERRVQEAKGTTGAAAARSSLQTMMNPKAAEAVEVLQDLKAGYYDDQQEKGEGDAPGGPAGGKEGTTDGEGTDA